MTLNNSLCVPLLKSSSQDSLKNRHRLLVPTNTMATWPREELSSFYGVILILSLLEDGTKILLMSLSPMVPKHVACSALDILTFYTVFLKIWLQICM